MAQQQLENSLERKWGSDSLVMGWTAIPSTLLFMQSHLGITTLGMNVLLNLITHWWERDEKPYPSQEAIATRMGVSKRSVQREIAQLCKKGLIKKTSSSVRDTHYRGRNTYDLTPLANILNAESPSLHKTITNNKKLYNKEKINDNGSNNADLF